MQVKHWIDQLSPASTIDGKYMCTIRNGRIEVTARGATQDNAYARAIRKLTMKLVEKRKRHCTARVSDRRARKFLAAALWPRANLLLEASIHFLLKGNKKGPRWFGCRGPSE